MTGLNATLETHTGSSSAACQCSTLALPGMRSPHSCSQKLRSPARAMPSACADHIGQLKIKRLDCFKTEVTQGAVLTNFPSLAQQCPWGRCCILQQPRRPPQPVLPTRPTHQPCASARAPWCRTSSRRSRTRTSSPRSRARFCCARGGTRAS